MNFWKGLKVSLPMLTSVKVNVNFERQGFLQAEVDVTSSSLGVAERRDTQ